MNGIAKNTIMHIKTSKTHPVGKAPAPTHPIPDEVPNKASAKVLLTRIDGLPGGPVR